MKKTILFAFAAIFCATLAYAQPRAIGGRLGYGIEFSYQHNLGKNMLSVDAGFPGLFLNNTIGAEGVVTYDWINPFGASFDNVWDGKGQWNWYMGVGAGVGGYFHHNTGIKVGSYTANYWSSAIFVGAAGRIGVEYNFWFPLQLSLDWRPVIGPALGYDRVYDSEGNYTKSDTYVSFNTAGLYVGGISLGVRYKF